MKVKDKQTGKIEIVINKTTNSYLVTQTKLTNNGISCDNWFTETDFNKRFQILNNEKG